KKRLKNMQMYPSGKKTYYSVVEEEYFRKDGFNSKNDSPPMFAMKCGDRCASSYLNKQSYEGYDNHGHAEHGWGGKHEGYPAQHSNSAYASGGTVGGSGYHYESYKSMGGQQQGVPLWNFKGIRD
ncbi:hypothetical protein ABTP16_03850, partial [Acinetobacter baumannii]